VLRASAMRGSENKKVKKEQVRNDVKTLRKFESKYVQAIDIKGLEVLSQPRSPRS
jgi:hypothetical protein